jgi:NRAMP (natural resistance-associated macrophage protein)-like metal ion transporter
MPSPPNESAPIEKRGFRRFFSNLGPGLITGAADDDPSGISTYSVAGAAFGYLPAWTALFSFPLMTAVQLMCARLGLVTGLGLAGVIRRGYSRWVLWGACSLLVVANVINIAADLGGMAEATMMVTGTPVALMVPVYAAVIVSLLMWSSYRSIARVFKWLTLVLLAYVLTAFVAHVDWRLALRVTFVPHMEWSRAFFVVLVAILGTTISPYLFFGCVESKRSAVACRTGGAECERRLSLSLSPRSPSLRFPSPLIEPDVTISVIRLSDGFHMEACTGRRR